MTHVSSDNWIRRFEVSDPQRHPKGFTVYKITSVVFPRNCPEAATKVVVWKRYKNFLKLHSDLKQRHEDLHLKVPFPPLPKAKFFGRFEDEIVEQRRQAVLVFLQFVADVPILFTSQRFVKFFESGYTLSTNPPQVLNNSDFKKGPQNSVQTHTDTVILSPDSSDSATTPESRSTSPTDTSVKLPSDNIIDCTSNEQSSNTTPALLIPVPFQTQQEDLHTESRDVHPLLFSSSSQSETSCVTLVSPTKHKEKTIISDRLDSSLESHEAQNDNEGRREAESVTEKTSEEEAGNESTNDDAVVGYITDAAYHLGLAAEHEASDDMEAAFAAYKAGIACLLSGVKDDPDAERVKLVKSKTAHYLLRAEKIYQQHLSESSKTSVHSQGAGRCLLLPLSGLKHYKVLGVASSVILVRNAQDNHTYVIKVLHKSPCPVDGRVRSILPANVPFMCRLYACFENESSVFLVLQHATGGLLWEHVHAYLNSPDNGPDSPPYIDQVVVSKKGRRPSCEHDSLSIVPEMQRLTESRSEKRDDVSAHEPKSTFTQPLRIPDVVLSETKDEAKSDEPVTESLKTDVYLKPDVVCVSESSEEESRAIRCVQDVDTVNLLEKAQRLLESVNKSLTNIEGVSSQAGALLETQVNVQRERRRPKRLAGVSPAGRSQDRSRRNSAVRRSRWEKKFSCDDMFEGRARALSGSLDREAQWLRMAVSTPCPRIPTATVRSWAAQLLLALEAIHRWGIIIRDLHPENLLLTSSAVLMLTYQCYWVAVDRVPCQDAVEQLYAAPEVSGIGPVTAAADWWSFGALLFELLSGESLANRHPGGFLSHSVLDIPSNVPADAADLLSQLLRHVPDERLGAGPDGVQSIKNHEFFKMIDWRNVLLLSATI